ncbi:hypothetical protein VP14_196 [Vibrio phage VPMCC14]|nr:hypothetical protein VP14_196 [Vibrio phage VPMCC14]
MKYTIPKKQLISRLEKLYSDEEANIVEYNNYVDKENFEREKQAEQDRLEAIEKYKSLPEDWWKQFTGTNEVTSTDKLIFNKTKTSTYFVKDLAEKYLKDVDVNLIISDYFVNQYYLPFEDCFGFRNKYIVSDIDTLSVLEWNKNIWGKLYSSDNRYTVYYSNMITLLVRKDQGDLIRLEVLVNKLKNLPEYVTEVTLEDSEIDLMNKFTKKENN